jgi:aspartyl-tRNA(Asn)/glutamyl-tRNA(Gln) amidotransferase subunit C
MISTEEIKKLAELARIEIKEEELAGLSKDMDSILAYLDQVKEMSGKTEEVIELGENYNIWREDIEPNEPGEYSKELIAEFPNSKNGYLKVKKILG